ncbi:hypothetical protein HELRODRAFT_66308, partial [Helobdella robusta]|uniref:F5/8 type C domain-containing protein n=1 Tax=Helobdella robusta TaxID=6412 RepID=T1FYJ6_HELRO
QWIQVDVGPPTIATALVTAGRGDKGRQHWVTQFTLTYSNDTENWINYRLPSRPKEDFVFNGNDEKYSEKINFLSHPITARYFRFHPIRWHRHISMRVAVIGCPYEGHFMNI